MATETASMSHSGPDPLVIDGTSPHTPEAGSDAAINKQLETPGEAWTREWRIGRYNFHYLRTKSTGWATEEADGVLAIQMVCWHRFVSMQKRTGHRFVIGRHSLWITKAR